MRLNLLIFMLLAQASYGAVEFAHTSGNYLDCSGTNFSNTSGDFSVAWWWKADTPTGNREELWSYGATGEIISAEVDSSGNLNIEKFGGTDIVTYAIPDTNWNHWAFVKQGSNKYLYLNGSEVHNSTVANSATTAMDFYIGAYYGFTSLVSDGKMDNLLVYNDDLTAAEVAIIHGSRSKIIIRSQNLVANYRFDENFAGTSISGSNAIKDISGNGNHCTAVGTATTWFDTILSYP